jgi:hypothetical protein
MYPDVTPPSAITSMLQSTLVLALCDKVVIAVNGFEHGANDPCLESIEQSL